MEELEEMLTEFFSFCASRNIKLKGSKFCVSEHMEFGGCRVLRSELGKRTTSS